MTEAERDPVAQVSNDNQMDPIARGAKPVDHSWNS